jgi:hypothetical protein
MHPDAAYYRKDPVFVRFCVALAFGVVLLLLYGLLTFPVLGWHPPGCVCDNCLERLDRDPERIEYLERMVER